MEHHDNHGQSVAAWTAVGILIVAFAVGSWAVATLNMPLLWISAGLVVVGMVAGKVLASMGYGVDGKKSVS